MAFNLKKYSQMNGTNPYEARFNEGNQFNQPGAVIKNGAGAENTQLTQDNSAEQNTPLDLSAIKNALSEIAETGDLSDTIKQDPAFIQQMNELKNDQSQSFSKLTDQTSLEQNAIPIYNFLETFAKNGNPQLLMNSDQSNIMKSARGHLSKLNEYLSSFKKGEPTMATNIFNLYKLSQKSEEGGEEIKGPKTSYEKEKSKEKSKGRGGNPFRVLMGMIGKMLDKGWNQQDITRHVKKHTSFQAETIKECIKIMKKYNKKLERDRHEGKEASGFNLRKIYAASAFERAERPWEKTGVYDIESDMEKKSTRELILRLKYLEDAKNFEESKDNDTRTNGPKGSLSSVSSEISKIESAMKKRGYTAADVAHEKEIIHKDKYYPYNTNVEED